MDRVMDALFASNHEQPQETVARRVHNARRLRKAGDLDGALAVFASVEPDTTRPNKVRWAYAEWLRLVRRTYRDRDLLVYSQGARAELRPRSPRRRDRGSPGCAGGSPATLWSSTRSRLILSGGPAPWRSLGRLCLRPMGRCRGRWP